MSWFKKSLRAEEDRKGATLWIKCSYCREIIYRKEMERHACSCPKCGYHFPISVDERIRMLLDGGTFIEHDRFLAPADPLRFKDLMRYKERIRLNQGKTQRLDALVMGEGTLCNKKVLLGFFDFQFMGGSMGTVVGEKFARGVERAEQQKLPLIVFSASGGARMQEGIFSLMQMAKTAAAIARLRSAGVPYISVLTDPTFGGVTASLAMLGDVILAEPRALIGFAGARVIEKTIHQKLPAGFQRAEFLLAHGMIDQVVPRQQLQETLGRLLHFFDVDRDTLPAPSASVQ